MLRADCVLWLSDSIGSQACPAQQSVNSGLQAPGIPTHFALKPPRLFTGVTVSIRSHFAGTSKPGPSRVPALAQQKAWINSFNCYLSNTTLLDDFQYFENDQRFFGERFGLLVQFGDIFCGGGQGLIVLDDAFALVADDVPR